MRRFVPRAVLTAALAVSAAACAAGTTGSAGSGTEGASQGGRYQVLDSHLQAEGGSPPRR